MKISKKLILLPISVLALTGCGKNDKDNDKKELPNAPVNKMTLTLADFCYTDVLPAPSITGLTAKNIKITYSYLNNETEARVGAYVAGSPAGTINAGAYKLKADVKTSTYKPFSLKTTFNVTKGEMPEFDLTIGDYFVDEVKPEPVTGDLVAGTTVTYQSYPDGSPEEKVDYVPGVANDLEPGVYHLVGTFTNPNYEDVVKTYPFVVKALKEFDEEVYELNTTSINIGALDVDFDCANVDLDSFFNIVVKSTSEPLDGVTFTWKEPYDFVGEENTPATIVAHKAHFVDKEFTILVTSTKTLVNIPGLFNGESGVEEIPYIVYDGEEHTVHVAGFDENRCQFVKGSKVMTETNAGEYEVEIALKDATHTSWSDGSITNKIYTWEIHGWNPAGSSSGYRLTVGSYVGENHDTALQIPLDNLLSPCTLKYEFLYDDWTEYTDFECVVHDSDAEYAHIDSDGKLVFDNWAYTIDVVIKTTNPNHSFNQAYTIKPILPSSRSISFTPTETTSSFYGADEATVSRFQGTLNGDGETYMLTCSSVGSGFGVNGHSFKTIDEVRIKFKVEENFPQFWCEAYLTESGEYIQGVSDPGGVNKKVPADYDGGWITYDLSGLSYDDEKTYYLRFWTSNSSDSSQSVLLSELQVDYTVA